MAPLPAQTIRHLCLVHSLVEPFFERTVRNGKTHGLGPAGYDVRIAEDLSLRPQEFALASTMERFQMPDDLLAEVKDKSSWARLGLTVQNTVIEPGWHGYLTLELTNHSMDFINLKAGDPIAQIIFNRLENPTELPYQGKYQNQEAGPQKARYESEAPRQSLCGDVCCNCGSFSLIRSGSCFTCQVCGETTGCS